MRFLGGDNRRVAIVSVLLLSFATQVVILTVLGSEVVAVFPEVEWLFTPTLLWSIAVICCIQAVLLILLRLLTLSDNGRIFHTGVTGWMLAMIVITLAGIGLLLFGHVVLSELKTYPPVVFIGIVLLVTSGAAFTLKLLKTLWQMRKDTAPEVQVSQGYQAL